LYTVNANTIVTKKKQSVLLIPWRGLVVGPCPASKKATEPSARVYIPGRSASRWGCHCSGNALAVGMNYSGDDRHRAKDLLG